MSTTTNVTDKQVGYLVKNCGMTDEEVRKLDRSEASALIGKDVEKRLSAPASSAQMTALTNLGCSKRFTNLRNREASMLITVLSALMGVDVAKTQQERVEAIQKMEASLRTAFKQQPTVQ